MLAMSGCSGVVSEFVGYKTEESPIIGESNTSTSPADNSSAEKTAFGGSSMQLGDNGSLIINRGKIGSVPMGEDGTWTVFVYLCGTDLESDGGFATSDVQKML